MFAGSYAGNPCIVSLNARTRTRRRASVFEPPYLLHCFVFADTLLATVYQTAAQDDNRNSGDTFAANHHILNHEPAEVKVPADGPDVRRTASRRPQIDGRANAVLADTSDDRRRQFSITAARSSRNESGTAGQTARPAESRENEP